MNDLIVLQSASGKHPEFGYPIGAILCRSKEDMEKAIIDQSIEDPIIMSYESYMKEKEGMR